MKYFGLVFYQLLILYASYHFGSGEEFDHDLELELVRIHDNMEGKCWQSVSLSKHKFSNSFIFKYDELKKICEGAFSSSDVEILEAFGNVVRFFLIRGTKQLFVNLLFTERKSAQLFFEGIRSQQKTGYERRYSVDKLIQYQIICELQNDDTRLEQFTEFPVFYSKKMNAEWFPGQKTINFAIYNKLTATRDVVLVLQSKTYNISQLTDENMYVLCSLNIVTHYFILLFSDAKSASNFYASVMLHLDKGIPCSTNWLTPEIMQKIL